MHTDCKKIPMLKNSKICELILYNYVCVLFQWMIYTIYGALFTNNRNFNDYNLNFRLVGKSVKLSSFLARLCDDKPVGRFQ